ncbi:ribonuclease H, partial [Trifolium pratense]
QLQDLHWAKVIWNSTIPPSKSLLAWRLMHNKMPTDDNLKIRGCALPSILNLVLQFNSMEDMWKVCDINWSPQCKVVITSALVNLLNSIWVARNQVRFSNGQANWKSSISMIIANTSMSDGAAKGNPGLAGCGGIFRNHVAEMLYCFAEPLGIATSFQAELCAVMTAIEVAHK